MNFATRRAAQLFALLSTVLCLAAAQSHAALQGILLHGFADGPSDGSGPQYNSSVSTDGTSLYGVTFLGGITNRGVLFKINVNGSSYQVLHFFNGISFGPGNTDDGANPEGTPLLIGTTLYGTTTLGGTNGLGTVYK